MQSAKGISKLLFGIFLMLFTYFLLTVAGSPEVGILCLSLAFVALIISVIGLLEAHKSS